MAGLVLLERGERTLEAQIVTPLRVEEYLGSKLVTLTALSIAEHLVIALIAVGTDFRPVPLVLGVVLASCLYCLAAFPAAVRYGSINEMIFPTVLWTLLFALPIIQYAGVWHSPLMYLHPFQAPLVILRGAVDDLRPWEWVYGVGYGTLWIALAFLWCRRAFRRFVVTAVGTR
jgi:fluoroquinolone transport system permease protein